MTKTWTTQKGTTIDINKSIKNTILCVLVCIFMMISNVGCTNNDHLVGINNKYKTVIKVYYSSRLSSKYVFFTDSSTDVCSFNGTNYLIEHGNQEELFSTTAPIELIKLSKIDENGNETKCERNYYKKY